MHAGEGNGTPLQYSCLENTMDGGAWWAAVHGWPKYWSFSFSIIPSKEIPGLISFRMDASPRQGRCDPDSLRPALRLGGQATAWDAKSRT